MTEDNEQEERQVHYVIDVDPRQGEEHVPRIEIAVLSMTEVRIHMAGGFGIEAVTEEGPIDAVCDFLQDVITAIRPAQLSTWEQEIKIIEEDIAKRRAAGEPGFVRSEKEGAVPLPRAEQLPQLPSAPSDWDQTKNIVRFASGEITEEELDASIEAAKRAPFTEAQTYGSSDHGEHLDDGYQEILKRGYEQAAQHYRLANGVELSDYGFSDELSGEFLKRVERIVKETPLNRATAEEHGIREVKEIQRRKSHLPDGSALRQRPAFNPKPLAGGAERVSPARSTREAAESTRLTGLAAQRARRAARESGRS